MPTGPHDGSHGDDCFGCKIKSINLAPSATPTRTRSSGKPRGPANSWERGILRDERGLPIRRGGEVIGVKQYADDRRRIDAQVKALKQGHDPALVT